jgi:hypothetical protein
VYARGLGPGREDVRMQHPDRVHRGRHRGLRGRHERFDHLQLDPERLAGRVLHGRADQVEEVTLDPLAREPVRDAYREGLLGEREAAGLAEPGRVGRVVQRLAEPGGNIVPEAFRRQLGLPLHACARSLFDLGKAASIPARTGGFQ